MEGPGNLCEIFDKPPVVACEPQERQGLSHRCRSRPSGYFLRFGGIGGHPIAGDDVTQVLHLTLEKKSIGMA